MKGFLFTYVMTYGGAAAALFNPFIGLLIYCCFAIVRPEAMWHWAVPQGGSYSRILAIALLLGWLGKGLGDWNFGHARPIVWTLLAYVGWVVGSTLFGGYPTTWTFLDNSSKYVLPWLVGITVVRSLEQVRTLAWVLMLSQAYVALEANREWTFGNREYVAQGFAGMDNNCNAIAMVAGTGLAYFLGMSTEKVSLRWLCFVSAGLMAHYPMFANSRGGMLALVVVAFVSFVLLPKQPRHYWYFTLAVLVGLRLAGPMVWERFNTSFESGDSLDYSAQSRLDLWTDALHMMQRYPLFGVGPDNFGNVVVEYGWPRGKECHSLWMQTGAELGLPGLLLLVAFYGQTLFYVYQLSRTLDVAELWSSCLARAVIASLIGFSVAAQFVSLEGLELPYYIVLIGASLSKLAPQTAQHAIPWSVAAWPRPSV